MLLVIDVGNTNMVFGLFRGERLEGSFRLKTDANSTSDELGLYLCEYFQRFGLRLDEVEDVVIGSVVPQIMYTLSSAVIKYVGKTPLILDDDLDPRLPYVACASEERLGPDRRRPTWRLWSSMALRWWCWISAPPQRWTP